MQTIIEALQKKQFDIAIALCEEALQKSNHPQIHLFLAIAYGEIGKLNEAIEIFEKLIHHFPQNADIYYNYALVLQNNSLTDDALAQYKKCLHLQAGNFSAWNNLGEIYRSKENFKAAIDAFSQSLRLQPNHLEYLRNLAIAYYQDKSFDKAQPLLVQLINSQHYETDDAVALLDTLISLRQLRLATEMGQLILKKFNSSSEIYNLLGLNELEKRKFKPAIEYLQKALTLEADCLDAMSHLASAYIFAGQTQQGLSLLNDILTFEQEAAYVFVCMMYETSNQKKLFSTTVEKGLRLFPDNEELLFFKAKTHKQKNNYQQSLELIDVILIQLKKGSLESSMRYQKGQLLDKLESYDLAWQEFNQANQLLLKKWRKQQSQKDTFIRICAKMEENYHRIEPVAEFNYSNLTGENLIFIVGFPRSGTTLLDSILSAHSEITVLEEAPILGETYDQIMGITPENYAETLLQLKDEEIIHLRQFYYTSLTSYTDWNNQGVLVDKSPLNTMHVGLIKFLFPSAKIVFSLRHPMDVCLSCFFQNFKMNSFMTNMTDIVSTAQTYDAMLRVWSIAIEKLNIQVRYQSYEALVTNFEEQTRTLFDFCGLKWQSQVLEFQKTLKNRGAISTPSFDQVNQPIYQSSKNRYKNYLTYLDKALLVLEPWIERFRYIEELHH